MTLSSIGTSASNLVEQLPVYHTAASCHVVVYTHQPKAWIGKAIVILKEIGGKGRK